MNRPSLGIAINCQNEEKHMAATIAQFYNVADDIVVIDGGSTDGSVEWAKRMGARVFYQPWEHNHAFQKNLGASKLSTDWIYIHDPDERLEPQLLDIMNMLTIPDGQYQLICEGILPPNENYPFDCFGIARKNFIDGVLTPVYPDYQFRLWKNTCYYDRNPAKRVHVELIGYKVRTEVDYKHATLEDPSRFNILHFKRNDVHVKNNVDFDRVMRGELGNDAPVDQSFEL